VNASASMTLAGFEFTLERLRDYRTFGDDMTASLIGLCQPLCDQDYAHGVALAIRHIGEQRNLLVALRQEARG